MSDKLPKILPCPFCGSEPGVMGSGEQQRGLMIHCIGENCPNPHTSYYDHASAIRVWNRRNWPPHVETVRGELKPYYTD